MKSKNLFAMFILGYSILISSGCSGQLKLDSHWRDRDVVVDGQQNEWHDRMTFVEKQNVSIGVFNDSEFLYLSLVTNNQAVRRQMIGLGFTLWLDPAGGNKKTFGIHYPLGRFGNGAIMPGGPPADGDEMPSDVPKPDFEKALQEFELIGPGKDERQRFPLTGAKGIVMEIEISNEALIYEIKIPLNQSEEYPYAIQAQSGKAVGVGFETAELDREALRERMGRGGFGDGRPGNGPTGIPPGGMGARGRMGGGRFKTPEPFKLWTSIALASGAAPSTGASSQNELQ